MGKVSLFLLPVGCRYGYHPGNLHWNCHPWAANLKFIPCAMIPYWLFHAIFVAFPIFGASFAIGSIMWILYIAMGPKLILNFLLCISGPIIGGNLSHPAEQYLEIFSQYQFLWDYVHCSFCTMVVDIMVSLTLLCLFYGDKVSLSVALWEYILLTANTSS